MEYVKLEDVCEIIMGQSPDSKSYSKEHIGLPFYQGNADFGLLNPTPTTWCNEPKKIAENGDILISVRAPIGALNIATEKCCIGRGLAALRNKGKVDTKYIYRFLFSKKNYLDGLGTGTTFKAIGKSILHDLQIPLPPKDQQQKIATHLDKITEAINNKKKQLALFDELVKSKFVEMFGDPVTNEMRWEKVLLKELAEIKIGPFGSLLHKQDYVENGHCLINPTHITEDRIIKDSTLSVSDEKYKELLQYHLFIDDIVLGRRGEMGRCAVVCEEGLLCGTGSIIIRPNGKMKPYFIQKMISNPVYKDELENKAVGVTMKNLNVSIVENLSLPLPPLPLQNQFADFVQKCDRAKSAVKQEITCLQELLDSKMQDFFGNV